MNSFGARKPSCVNWLQILSEIRTRESVAQLLEHTIGVLLMAYQLDNDVSSDNKESSWILKKFSLLEKYYLDRLHILLPLRERYALNFLLVNVVGSLPCVVVSTAEAARALFRANDEHLSSRPKFLSFAILTEYKTMGAAPSTGKFWHSLRRLRNSELLSAKRVASYEGIRKEEPNNMMQVLLKTSNRGEAINVKQWLFQTAANLTTWMLVNKRWQESKQSSFDLKGFWNSCLREFRLSIFGVCWSACELALRVSVVNLDLATMRLSLKYDYLILKGIVKLYWV